MATNPLENSSFTVKIHNAIILLSQGEEMAQVLVRQIDGKIITTIKKRALKKGKSLEAELRNIIETAAKTDVEDIYKAADRLRKKLANRKHSDSALLIREDRDR